MERRKQKQNLYINRYKLAQRRLRHEELVAVPQDFEDQEIEAQIDERRNIEERLEIEGPNNEEQIDEQQNEQQLDIDWDVIDHILQDRAESTSDEDDNDGDVIADIQAPNLQQELCDLINDDNVRHSTVDKLLCILKRHGHQELETYPVLYIPCYVLPSVSTNVMYPACAMCTSIYSDN